jgi:hypothetical protein
MHAPALPSSRELARLRPPAPEPARRPRRGRPAQLILAWMLLLAAAALVMPAVQAAGALGEEIGWRGGLWQRMIPATAIHLGANLAWVVAPFDPTTAVPWLLPVPAATALVMVLAFAVPVRSRRGRPPRAGAASATLGA